MMPIFFCKHSNLFSASCCQKKEDHCGRAIASVWSVSLLLVMRDYFNMGANLSSGLLSLSSPAAVCESYTMILFVIPREFFSVPPSSPSRVFTCLWVPRCVCVCVTGGLQVCVPEYLSHSKHVIGSILLLLLPYLSPPLSTQFDCKSDGRAIWQQHKGPWFLWLWLWLWWWLVFISTIWWNPWLKLTGVEQVQYRGRWRIPVMSP